ncbi:MAG: UbiA family prenyltransferase [Chitinophagales bacterium]
MSVPYLFVALEKPDFNRSTFLLLLAATTATGFAAFGYLTNDWSDMKKDALAGKKNMLSSLGFVTRALLLTLALIFAIGPWYYLPYNIYSVIMFIGEVSLFLLYAFPPFRLKEKGVAGILADALYAHAVPALFAGYTFALAITPFSLLYPLLTILFFWQLIIGIRNILIHQIEDIENDKSGDNRTFVIKVGVNRAKWLIIYCCIPFEVLFLITLLIFMAYLLGYVLTPMLVVYWLLLLYVNRAGLNKILDYKDFAYLVLDDFYIECLPLCLLTYMVVHNCFFLILIAIHLAIFPKNILIRIGCLIFPLKKTN